MKHPVVLNKPYRLVYSPHVYGPAVYVHPYMMDPSYPTNLPAM